ncbi:MAG: YebC/PmpR family DNA-binding transcriptional regulator, partial [Victivallaceae bacterium]
IFSRIAKEIMVAAKAGGADASANPRLRSALSAAKASNMPNDNIERAIKKGTGELGNVIYEEIVYEGYGPGGVAVLVECLTDNRNRSSSEVRTAFDRSNGNLAASGAVSRLFSRKAHFVITGEAADEEKLMELTLDAGAEDIECEDGYAEIWAEPNALDAISEALKAGGITPDEAEVIQRSDLVAEITDAATANSLLKLIDKIEDLDDVQSVSHNASISDEILETLE